MFEISTTDVIQILVFLGTVFKGWQKYRDLVRDHSKAIADLKEAQEKSLTVELYEAKEEAQKVEREELKKKVTELWKHVNRLTEKHME